MRRAFTLIELLVVIAIIAILAAILFPVFAQAKLAAKKTQTISNYKQTGTSTQIYLADYDDLFPLGQSFNSAGNAFRSGTYTVCPAGWATNANRHLEPRKSEEGAVWMNSLQPYIKNLQLYEGAGLNDYNPGFTPATGFTSNSGAKMNANYNGMLGGYPQTAVASVSRVPLFSGTLWQNVTGGAVSSPELDCAGQTCRFTPGAAPSNIQFWGGNYGYAWYGFGGTTKTWQYGRGMIFTATDSSTRWVGLNAPIWPTYAENVNVNPWSARDPGDTRGNVYWMTDCVNPGGNKASSPFYYPGYYRPDSEFTWTLQQCDFGGG